MASKNNNPNLEHRERMRERVIQHGTETLADYELLEMLLYHVIPRQDTKPQAKKLVDRFSKSLEGLFHCKYDDLIAVEGVGPKTALMITLIREISLRISKEKAFDKEAVLNSWSAVLDFCRVKIGHSSTEIFMVIFLDSTNRLIKHEEFETGTVNKVAVYPREIVKLAITYNAVSVILVHNHPSGDTTPSKQDITMTKTIKEALKTIDVTLHDHIIVSASSHTSFKEIGLM
jgi:DNA repair protein RadC